MNSTFIQKMSKDALVKLVAALQQECLRRGIEVPVPTLPVTKTIVITNPKDGTTRTATMQASSTTRYIPLFTSHVPKDEGSAE